MSRYAAVSSHSSLDPSTVRRKIYAELLKLVKKSWLKRVISKKKGLIRFSKTEFFDVEIITLNTKVLPDAPSDDTDDKHAQLLVKLNHYKNEFLLSLGESEAYKELYLDLPELVDEIQPKYNKTRDNNTKLLGKIRAIEGLLKQDKPLEKI